MKNKWIDFGLFGPCLTFNTNNDPEEPNRLVISLFICKLYIRKNKIKEVRLQMCDYICGLCVDNNIFTRTIN